MNIIKDYDSNKLMSSLFWVRSRSTSSADMCRAGVDSQWDETKHIMW